MWLWRSAARQQDARRSHQELLRAAPSRNLLRRFLRIVLQEPLHMLQCRSRSPDSCRFLIRESGASGREVRWQPKLRLLSDGCVDWRATRQPLPFLNMSLCNACTESM
jgi:hypothetical protein